MSTNDSVYQLPKMNQGVLCAAADLVWDFIVLLEHPVELGGTVEAVLQGVRGGSAANVAEAVSFLGGKARFVGQIGDDALGAQMVDELFRRGVAVQGARRGRSAQLLSLVNPDADRSFVIDTGGQNDLYPDDIDPLWLENAAALHISGHSFVRPHVGETMQRLAQLAHDKGLMVTLDGGSGNEIANYPTQRYREALIATHPDVLFINEQEANVLDIDPNSELAPSSVPEGVELVVIHRGSSSTIAVHRGGRVEVETPLILNLVDTTGAGDAFNAGFLVEWQHGMSLEQCIEAGHRVAGQVITRPGGSLF